MPKTVSLAAFLPAHPDRLYEMYLDPQLHSAITGSTVTIEPRAGAAFRAFDDRISGVVLHVAPKRLIVQTWRSTNWPGDAADSVLILTFWPQADGGRVELEHVHVPESDFAGVSQGWEKHYWTPWRKFLLDGARG
jgi:activator of HSP90 ATPase